MSEARTPRPAGPVAAGAFAFDRNARRVAGVLRMPVVGCASPANPVNFGWPCFEGAGRMSSYDSANLTICENLYADTVRPATSPYYA
jgi:hypothetical protein